MFVESICMNIGYIIYYLGLFLFIGLDNWTHPNCHEYVYAYALFNVEKKLIDEPKE